MSNAITMTVVEKFKNQDRYGFVFLLEVDTSKIASQTYSIVHEYADGVFGANFQTWNLKFFGFYEKYVLFHNKQHFTPGDNNDRHVLIAENMEADALRKKIISRRYLLLKILIFFLPQSYVGRCSKKASVLL